MNRTLLRLTARRIRSNPDKFSQMNFGPAMATNETGYYDRVAYMQYCIAGHLAALIGWPMVNMLRQNTPNVIDSLGELLGLDDHQRNVLFGDGCTWPAPFGQAYREALEVDEVVCAYIAANLLEDIAADKIKESDW